MEKSITVYAVSDMTGETVARVVRAASAQFAEGHVHIKVLSNATSAEQVVDFIRKQNHAEGTCAVFHTILSKHVREDLRNALQTLRIPSIDLLGSTAHVMADLLDERPQRKPGLTIDNGAEPEVFDLANER
jgi:regulator of PEP synthase PpsR (kinase-PPPase family)